MLKLIEQQIAMLTEGNNLTERQREKAQNVFNNGDCLTLTQIGTCFEFFISTPFHECEVTLLLGETEVMPYIENSTASWDEFTFAALLQLRVELETQKDKEVLPHKKYSRQGMIKRVLAERASKAAKAEYRIEWADNIHGDHILTNENGVKYTIFLRDFENETGYSSSLDSRYNKLGTSKHLMYAFTKLKENPTLRQKLDQRFPFVEIFLDPLNDYKISWFYPDTLPEAIDGLIHSWFGNSTYIEHRETGSFFSFIREAEQFQEICIRPEVMEKIEQFYDDRLLAEIAEKETIDFSVIKADLYQYQKEGITFAAFRKNAIIADEMGLGKTVQAIAAAVAKGDLFGFRKSLIVCPASLKSQWKSEIEKFTDKTAVIIGGTPEERQIQYRSDAFFLIVNYESVMRDQTVLADAKIDFLILDEAQRVKNFETKTAASVKRINARHTLIITGTPIENKLLDIFSLAQILDPAFLGPLWEFSYQHCLFDPERKHKINGYFNLQELKERLAPILLRREKRKVIEELPNVNQLNVPVPMHPIQAEHHASCSQSISMILHKKFITPADMNRLRNLLTVMRMVCNSTFLVDKKSNHSPKLDELKFILKEKLDLKNSDRKVIIFSEWTTTHKLIGQLLRKEKIGFSELNGKVPVAKREELIKNFENNPKCQVFLSTEAGGAGLNLQVADTVINFELPWNPAKKNQRIGRIDRLGQKNEKLTVINLITTDSIESRIASGLVIKENLFESVLNEGNTTNIVDFSEKGRSQFLKDIEEMATSFESQEHTEEASDPYITELDNELQEDAILEEQEHITEEDPNSCEKSDRDSSVEQSVDSISSDDYNEKTIQADQMEGVLNQGLGFLSGLMQMATGGKDSLEKGSVTVDRSTGEVTMKFKLPGF